jgi:hypothetical protein
MSCGPSQNCSEKVVTVLPAAPPCPQPECVEYYSMSCVAYTGAEIPYLNIKYGDRMDVVVQKLIQAVVNPSCIDNSLNECKSVFGIRVGTITSTTIEVFWESPFTTGTYEVQFKKTIDTAWVALPTTSELNDTIPDLDPGTDYNIRIRSVCNESECLSIDIILKTLNI